ncbi:hypothetical protein BDR07DRAFT_840209 [Suillus spraguei]|nr:hypothetical protein BDR07DRAFT_721428 [Suillus spraguei]KAG2364070.1 hypothetical protein BDR07DRAFT_840209 [Suillus spraguei]
MLWNEQLSFGLFQHCRIRGAAKVSMGTMISVHSLYTVCLCIFDGTMLAIYCTRYEPRWSSHPSHPRCVFQVSSSYELSRNIEHVVQYIHLSCRDCQIVGWWWVYIVPL